MKVIIAGSRGIENYSLVKKCVIESRFNITEIISGVAKGVDKLGESFGRENNIPVKRFPAKWNDLNVPGAIIKTGAYGDYNARAGMDRNWEMADYADALVCIILNNSSGSRDMVNKMRSLCKPVYEKHITLRKKK